MHKPIMRHFTTVASLCLSASLGFSVTTNAQPVDLITNVHARATTTLNGAWRTIVDPFENGYYDYRYEPHTDGGYFANRKPASKSDLIEYDFGHDVRENLVCFFGLKPRRALGY